MLTTPDRSETAPSAPRPRARGRCGVVAQTRAIRYRFARHGALGKEGYTRRPVPCCWYRLRVHAPGRTRSDGKRRIGTLRVETGDNWRSATLRAGSSPGRVVVLCAGESWLTDRNQGQAVRGCKPAVVFHRRSTIEVLHRARLRNHVEVLQASNVARVADADQVPMLEA